MNLFNKADFDNHERVVFVNDAKSGLRAIIAIHNTKLGPAMGGCRMYPYASDDAALTDALRLSRGMSYKSAMAGLPLGGGKSVIIGDPKADKTNDLLRAMANAVDDLGGNYVIAQDSGTSVADMRTMAQWTDFVAGGEQIEAQDSKLQQLDPSPSTAYGVFKGLEAAVKFRFDGRSLQGVRVAIQGLGNVGYGLAQHLHQAGAQLFVQDIVAANVQRAVKDFGASELVGDQIFRHPVDVFAPCALGGVINDETLDQLNCRIVAGAANNQLVTANHGIKLAERDILYVPDYVLNAGGIICIHHARMRQSLQQANEHVAQIADTVMELLQRAKYSAERPESIADRMAEERLQRPAKDISAVA